MAEESSGVERFLRKDGRIDRYPRKQDARRLLLEWVAGKVLKHGERLDERSFNERLSEYSDDYVMLRRYLVDAQLVERTPDGSAYFLPRSGE
ncbi:hypothetical protein BIU82_07840 [Arthrobacter sp. SW1]|uniref:DUF2087 domain-containing protein n=1 Tax=Arthrobacter sp. SW1 TaxID=1920889 RepID=UPI000877AFD3|nr:DUF2087 domain-containing protein [Arthrobacter sp. SW1]OFI37767.1 hypothetical protein BIU82_07840 [Arthrobacter sp. SW1]